jgi:hypothetical protein
MTGNIYGLFVGIDKYNDENSLHTLSYAEKDAKDLLSVFTDPNVGNIPSTARQ